MTTRPTAPRTLRVVMISSEVEPLARTGGLGDAVGSLSLALAERGMDVLVVTPRYGVTQGVSGRATRWPLDVPARWGWGPSDVRKLGVSELAPTRFSSGGVRRLCVLEDAALFDRAGIYGDEHGEFGDNAQRFAVMSRGALEVASRVWPDGPDIIHAHDWHAAFAVLYARLVMGPAWARVPSVFTVHNLQFQGVLDEGAVDRLHLPRSELRPEVLRHEGHVNLMKGATYHADRITTVSPTYAREILEPAGGFGLDVHLRAHAQKLVGVLNGIDVAQWDPRKDPAIAARYDEHSASVARKIDKAALASELSLDDDDGPLFGVVSRLSWQKGIDLLIPFLPELVARGARVVIVGTGDAVLERQLAYLARAYPTRIAARLAFDPPLSRRVYAGSDFLIVPSRFEPCGLTQMYAMRYGSVPIVTDVGGLHDTVAPISRTGSEGTGIVASAVTTDAIYDACLDAMRMYDERSSLDRVVARAMRRSHDFAWTSSARTFHALFDDVRRRRE